MHRRFFFLLFMGDLEPAESVAFGRGGRHFWRLDVCPQTYRLGDTSKTGISF